MLNVKRTLLSHDSKSRRY